MDKIKKLWVHRITREDGTTILTNGAFLREYCDEDWRLVKKLGDGWIPMKVVVPEGLEAVECAGNDILIGFGGEFRRFEDVLVLDGCGMPALEIGGEVFSLRECPYGPTVKLSGKEEE